MKYFSHLIFILMILVLIPNVLFAQNDRIKKDASYQFEISVYQGFIADVSKNFSSLSNNYIYPVSISASKRFYPINHPYPSFNYPRYGLSFYYANLRNPEILGSIYSLYPWVRVYLFEHNKFKLSISASLGFVYTNKHFHPTQNYKNIIFSSPVFFTFGFEFQAEYALTSHTSLSTGFTFNHFSNGELRLPNFGTNIPSLKLSFLYKNLSHEDEMKLLKNKSEKNYTHTDRKYSFLILPTIGSRDVQYPKNPFNLTASLNLEFIYKTSKWNRMSVGAVTFYDKAQSKKLKYYNEVIGIESNNTKISPYSLGIYMGHEVDMRPLLIIFQIGKYISNKNLFFDDNYFNKIGIRYFISDHLFFNMTHKSGFFFKGNNIEWGIGYEI